MIRQTNTKRAGMKLLKWLPVLLMSAVLWACGGGDSDAGTSLFAPESGALRRARRRRISCSI